MGAHIRELHPHADISNPQDIIEMRILDQRNKNMERGITEAVLIEEIENDTQCIVTNRKSEWGRAPIRALTVRNNLE